MGYWRFVRWAAVLVGLAATLLYAQGVDTLYVEDFNDGDLSDWNLVRQLGGEVDTTRAAVHSQPYALRAFAPGYDAVANARSPFVDFPQQRQYRVTFWFETPVDTNEYLVAFDNGDVFLMVFGSDLYAATGTRGAEKWNWIAPLGVDTFHFIDLRVRPMNGRFDVYVDDTFRATLPTFYVSDDTFRVGFYGDGYGEGYWDDFCITTWPRIQAIAGVPDHSQPPQSGTCCWSVPTASVNLLEYWATQGLAPGILDGWSWDVAADSVGWFLGTNGTGSPDRENNPTFPLKGTRLDDIFPGLSDFAAWGGESPDSFSVPWPPNASKTEWNLEGSTYDCWSASQAWSAYQIQADSGLPSLVIFMYWNLDTLRAAVYDTVLQDTVYFYTWGPYADSSVSPREYWNGEMLVGHGVTGIGYYQYYDPDGAAGAAPCTTWILVHDTWAGTPRTLAVPWEEMLGVVTARPHAVLAAPPLKIVSIGWEPLHPPFFTAYEAFANLENTSDALIITGMGFGFRQLTWGFWGHEVDFSSGTLDTLYPGQTRQVYAPDFFTEEGFTDSIHRWEMENLEFQTWEISVRDPGTGDHFWFDQGPSAHRGLLSVVVDTSVYSLQVPVPVYNREDTVCAFRVQVTPLQRSWSVTLSPDSVTLVPETEDTLWLYLSRSGAADTTLSLKLHAVNLTRPDSQDLYVEVHVQAPRFYDDFTDCDLSDWVVDTAGGGTVGMSEDYVVPPCALGIFSAPQRAGDMHAWVRSPGFSLPDTAHYTLDFYVKPFDAYNFTLMDNHQVVLFLGGSGWKGKVSEWFDVFAAEGDSLRWVGDLNANQWNHVACLVSPDSGTYDLYINGYYMETVGMYDTVSFPYLRFGDFSSGTPDTLYGSGVWDRLEVLPYHLSTCYTGDLDGDEELTPNDLAVLADYLFYGGDRPVDCADVNYDQVIDPLDLVALSQMIYGKKGPGPRRLAHGPMLKVPRGNKVLHRVKPRTVGKRHR